MCKCHICAQLGCLLSLDLRDDLLPSLETKTKCMSGSKSAHMIIYGSGLWGSAELSCGFLIVAKFSYFV